jgi:hypothetical protein
MANSKPDIGRDVGKLEGSVGLLTKFSFAIIGLLGLVVAGGITILLQLGDIKSDLALAKKDIAYVSEKMAKIDANTSETQRAQSSAAVVLARIDQRLSAQREQQLSPQIPIFQISDAEAQFVREYLNKIGMFDKVNALSDAANTTLKVDHKVGDTIPNAPLFEFPSELLFKLPKLKGSKFTIENDAVLIVSAEDRRVLAIISKA